MIFVEASTSNGYKQTSLKKGDAVVLFTDVNRVIFWRDNRYLFWSPLSELPELLFPVTDIKLFYDFDGGPGEFRNKAVLFAAEYGFNLKRKEVLFKKNILGKEIPYIAFEFIKEGEEQNDAGMPQM